MKNIDDIIERYLNDGLSTTELTEFKQLLETDKALETKVKQELMIKMALEAHEKDAFKQQLKGLKQHKIIPLKNNRKRQWLSIAAAIALLLIPAFQFFQHSNTQIASQYYEKDESIASQLLSPDEAQSPYNLAMNAYRNENYSLASEQLLAIKNNARATYTLGHTYYLSKNYQKGIEQFKAVIKSQNPEYLEKSEWYLLLSLLKMNQTNGEFHTLLGDIIDKNGVYSESAKAIQAKLNSNWRFK